MYPYQNTLYILTFTASALIFCITYTAIDDPGLSTIYDDLSNGLLLNDIGQISDKKQKMVLPELLLPSPSSQNVMQVFQPPPTLDFLFPTPDDTILKRDGVFLSYFFAQEFAAKTPYIEPPPTQWKRFEIQEKESLSCNDQQENKEYKHNRARKRSLLLQTPNITEKHKHISLKPKIHPCLLCDKKYTTRHIVRRHIQEVHLIIRPYFCFKCTHTSTTAEKAKQHLTSHCIQVDLETAHIVCFDQDRAEQVLTTTNFFLKMLSLFQKK